MKKVIVKGPILSQSGYGEHTRFVVRALRSRPDLFDVHLLALNWGKTGWLWEESEERTWIDDTLAKTVSYMQSGGLFDMSLQITIPQEWEKLAPVNIGITAGTETTRISPQWMSKCLEMDKIVVVSEHTKFAFEDTKYIANDPNTNQQFIAKVNCPIEVVHYPVKTFENVDVGLDLKYDTNFLTVGTWIPRKNMENTIIGFVEQFKDQEVGLIIKTSTAKNSLVDRRLTATRLKNVLSQFEDRKCEVYLLHGDMTDAEMNSLYNHDKVKALVSLSHAEGFGLPLFEAAYNGLPVIATDWSGHLDFLTMPQKGNKTKKMFLPVSYDLKNIQKEAVWDGVLQADSQWAFPKSWDYKKKLKSIISNYGEAKSKAVKLKEYLLKEFSEESQYNKMVESFSIEEAEQDQFMVM